MSEMDTENDEVLAEWVKRFVSVIKQAGGDSDEPARCIECGQPVTELRQVGRCVYGNPCGHRQYQGKLAKK